MNLTHLGLGVTEITNTVTFTVRRDDGVFFEVHGWLVDVTMFAEEQRLLM